MMVGRDAVPAGVVRTLVPGRSPEQRPGEGPTRPVNRKRPIARIPRGAPEVAGTPAQVVLRARRYRACPLIRAVRRNPDNAPYGAPSPSAWGRKEKSKDGRLPTPKQTTGASIALATRSRVPDKRARSASAEPGPICPSIHAVKWVPALGLRPRPGHENECHRNRE